MNQYNASPKWARLHTKILPNYLNSFNFKVHYNLLPVRAKFVTYQLDNDSRCFFCKVNFETPFHIFGKCNKLMFIWDFMDEIMSAMKIEYSFMAGRRRKYEIDVMSIPLLQTSLSQDQNDFKILHYLTTIINYHLWKSRNECVHEKNLCHQNHLLKELFDRLEHVGDCKYIQVLQKKKRFHVLGIYFFTWYHFMMYPFP